MVDQLSGNIDPSRGAEGDGTPSRQWCRCWILSGSVSLQLLQLVEQERRKIIGQQADRSTRCEQTGRYPDIDGLHFERPGGTQNDIARPGQIDAALAVVDRQLGKSALVFIEE